MLWWLLACTPAPSLPRLLEVPDFTLTSQENTPVSRNSLHGKVWVADFIFTSCPGPCPILSAKFSELQAHYSSDPDFTLLSFTVDPATDTPSVLATYASRFNKGNNWFFLTGDPAMVQTTIVDGFKQMVQKLPGEDGKPPDIMHSERLVLVDREGWMRAFPDINDPPTLYTNIDAVLKEGR